jgi:hypothetical protein
MANKLNESEVLDIYARIKNGDRYIDIANDYSVSKSMIYCIAKKKVYAHLNIDALPCRERKSKISRDDAVEIRKMINDGKSPSDIAHKFRVGDRLIHAISRGEGKRWAEFEPISRKRKTTDIANRIAGMTRKNELSGCIEWTGAKDRRGYGLVKDASGIMKRVPRIVYELFVGKIPDGMLIRHTCDNPCCCNPEHLLVGTAADNSMDAVERNRLPVGEMSGASKLKNNDIPLIFKLKKDGSPARQIANFFGVNESTIFRILSGKSWKHINSETTNT